MEDLPDPLVLAAGLRVVCDEHEAVGGKRPPHRPQQAAPEDGVERVVVDGIPGLPWYPEVRDDLFRPDPFQFKRVGVGLCPFRKPDPGRIPAFRPALFEKFQPLGIFLLQHCRKVRLPDHPYGGDLVQGLLDERLEAGFPVPEHDPLLCAGY